MIWDDWNTNHIKKHDVKREEVEEVYYKPIKIVKTKFGRKMVFGKTKSGRMLTVVLSFEKQACPYVVSARDASIKERRQL